MGVHFLALAPTELFLDVVGEFSMGSVAVVAFVAFCWVVDGRAFVVVAEGFGFRAFVVVGDFAELFVAELAAADATATQTTIEVVKRVASPGRLRLRSSEDDRA